MSLRLFPVLLCCLLAGACAKPPSVQTRFDRQVDFTRLRTYQWLENTPQVQLDAVADDQFDRTIRNAITYTLEEKGLTPVARNADLIVSYRTDLRQSFADQPAALGKNRESSWGFAPWRAFSRPPEGSLSIEMIDPARDRTIWQGTARTTVRSREEARARIFEVVRALLAEYPPRVR